MQPQGIAANALAHSFPQRLPRVSVVHVPHPCVKRSELPLGSKPARAPGSPATQPLEQRSERVRPTLQAFRACGQDGRDLVGAFRAERRDAEAASIWTQKHDEAHQETCQIRRVVLPQSRRKPLVCHPRHDIDQYVVRRPFRRVHRSHMPIPEIGTASACGDRRVTPGPLAPAVWAAGHQPRRMRGAGGQQGQIPDSAVLISLTQASATRPPRRQAEYVAVNGVT